MISKRYKMILVYLISILTFATAKVLPKSYPIRYFFAGKSRRNLIMALYWECAQAVRVHLKHANILSYVHNYDRGENSEVFDLIEMIDKDPVERSRGYTSHFLPLITGYAL